jgi:hypothetical protein
MPTNTKEALARAGASSVLLHLLQQLQKQDGPLMIGTWHYKKVTPLTNDGTAPSYDDLGEVVVKRYASVTE